MVARVLVSGMVFVGLVACGGDERKSVDPTTSEGASTPGSSSSSSSSSSGSGATTKGDGNVGSACAAKADCSAALGLDCVTVIEPVPQAGFAGKTFPGGYCTKRCGQPNPDSPFPADQELSLDCGPSATCQQSSQSTGQGGQVSMQMCVRTCTSNEDCRAKDGYVCLAGAFGQRTCAAP